MGKCMSASLDLEDSTKSNTDAPGSKQVMTDTDHEATAASAPSNGQTVPTKVNISSLSESDEDETEPAGASVKTAQPASKNATNNKTQPSEHKTDEKSEVIPALKYVEPTPDELAQQQELEVAHISHRGHYLNECQWSAQNMLQRNEFHYGSLKGYHFNPYDAKDTDWIILKICSNDLHRVTSLTIEYAVDTLVEQYPSTISLQFLSENSLSKALVSNGWTKPYIISPNPLCTERPKDTKTAHSDTFNIAMCSEYLKGLRRTKYDQYVRISFIEAHNEGDTYDGDEGKYAVHDLRLFGVRLLDEDGDVIGLENTVSQQTHNKNYKVDITNNAQCKLSPEPGPKNARVMMREHIFFVNTENKTILQLKQAICDEYNRFVKGSETYQPKQLLLIEGAFGLINDMMDGTILSKTLNEIGATAKKNNGHYI
eukprot:143876_1